MDAAILAMRAHLHLITKISCIDAPLTSSSAVLLASCEGLQSINLSNTLIDDEAVLALVQNETLKSVDISFNEHITALSMDCLKSSSLSSLNIEKTAGLLTPFLPTHILRMLHGFYYSRRDPSSEVSSFLRKFYGLTPCDELVIQNPHLTTLIVERNALSDIGKRHLAKRQSEFVASSLAATLSMNREALKETKEEKIDATFFKDSIYPLMDHVVDFLVGDRVKKSDSTALEFESSSTSTSLMQQSLSAHVKSSASDNTTRGADEKQQASASSHSKSSRFASFAQQVETLSLSKPGVSSAQTITVPGQAEFLGSLLLFGPLCLDQPSSDSSSSSRKQFRK